MKFTKLKEILPPGFVAVVFSKKIRSFVGETEPVDAPPEKAQT